LRIVAKEVLMMPFGQRWAVLTRRRRRTLIAVVVVSLYALAGFVVIPAVLRAKVPAMLADTLGRPVTIDRVRLNPFALTLAVSGFRIDDTDGEPLLSFRDLFVDVQSSSIFHRALVLEEVRLTAPGVRLRRLPDGELSFADIRERLAAGGEPAEDPAPSEPFPLVVHHARIERGRIVVRDESRPTPFEENISPIDVSLDDFATRAGDTAGSPYSFSATTENGATLTWEGTLAVLPLRSQGEIRLTNFRSRTPWRYLRDDLRFEITSGWADVSAQYELDSSDEEPLLRVSDAVLSLHDITLFEEGATRPLIVLPSFVASGGALDLQKRTVTIASIASQGARGRSLRDENGLFHLVNVFSRRERDAVAEAAQPGAAPESAPASGPAQDPGATPAWSVTIDSIDLSDYGVDFEDRTTPTPAKLTFAPISLSVRKLSTTSGEPAAIDLSVGFEHGGRLGVAGKVSPKAPSADVMVKLAAFALPLVQPYVDVASGAKIRQGTLGVDLSLRHDGSANGEATSLEGRLDLKGLDIGTRSGADVLRLDALALRGIKANLAPVAIEIAKVVLDRPSLRFERRSDGSTNLAELASDSRSDANPDSNAPADSPPAEATPTQPSSTDTPQARMGQIEISDGALTVADAGATPDFRLNVTDLAMTASNVALDAGAQVAIDAKARIERTSSLEIRAVVSPLSNPTDAELKLTLAGLDTAVFSPYSGRYIGQHIARGKLDLDLDYTVESAELAAKNEIVLHGFTLGKRVESPDAVDLPVGLAVALLKDTRGRITLDVPISGRLDDPSFRLDAVILDTLRNLILKAATAPFALIGGLVGGGEDLGYVAFAPGRADLAETERDKLSQLARGLAERPALAVEVPGTASPALDAPALREIALEGSLRSMRFEEVRGKSSAPAAASEVVLDDKLRTRLIAEAYESRLGGRVKDLRAQAPATNASGAEVDAKEWAREEMRRRLLESMPVGEAEIADLARRRAQAVVDVLIEEHGVAPARVSTVAPNLNAPEEGPDVKTELVLIAG